MKASKIILICLTAILLLSSVLAAFSMDWKEEDYSSQKDVVETLPDNTKEKTIVHVCSCDICSDMINSDPPYSKGLYFFIDSNYGVKDIYENPAIEKLADDDLYVGREVTLITTDCCLAYDSYSFDEDLPCFMFEWDDDKIILEKNLYIWFHW